MKSKDEMHSEDVEVVRLLLETCKAIMQSDQSHDEKLASIGGGLKGLISGGSTRKPTAAEAIVETLRKAGGAVSTKDIRVALGGLELQPQTINVTLSRLLKAGQIAQEGRGRYKLSEQTAGVSATEGETQQTEGVSATEGETQQTVVKRRRGRPPKAAKKAPKAPKST